MVCLFFERLSLLTPLEKAADFNRRSLPIKGDGGLKPPSPQTVRERSSLTGFTRQNLYYWRSKSGMAELDFLCEADSDIYPLEVKSGVNPKSKSFTSYDQQFNPLYLVRTTLLNLKKDGKICNIPLYAMMLLFKLMKK